MKGAIIYSTKYGSTAEYANWIGEATGLPVLNIKDKDLDPTKYDFIVLGTPIIYYKLHNRKWVNRNWSLIKDKPIIFFTVSGAGASPKLDKWFADSLPENMTAKMKHVALKGRQIPAELTLFDRTMLKIAASQNKDPQASKEEREGFDYMDKSSIEPIVKMVKQFQLNEELSVK